MDAVVSIIVPLYNAQAYLEQCVESILAQTYRNLEIILVNDGSTDTSAAICDHYRKLDARIKVLYQENGGVSSARNRGLDAATGEFIFFVDSDDWISPDCIEKLCREQERTGSDIVVTNYIVFHQASTTFRYHINDEQYFVKTYSIEEYVANRYNLEFFLGYCFLFPWGSLYRKKLFELVRYPLFKLAEDNYTSYKLFLLANQITFINQSNYIRREREGSLVSELSKDGEFPVQTLEQRIALLATMGMDYQKDITDYIQLLHRAKEIAAKTGDQLAYKENCLKLDLIARHRKDG